MTRKTRFRRKSGLFFGFGRGSFPRKGINARQFVVGEGGVFQRPQVVFDLRRGAGPDITDVTRLSRRSHASAISASVWPRCRAMSFRARDVPASRRSAPRAATNDPPPCANPAECRRGNDPSAVPAPTAKGDEARTRRGGKRQHARSFGLAAEDIVPVLKKQARNVAFGEVAEGETRRFERVARQSDVERLPRRTMSTNAWRVSSRGVSGSWRWE